MPSVTKKFNTLKSNTGWTLSNFVGNASAGTATSTTTGNNFTLEDPVVNDTTSGNNSTFSSVIPSNATITGIETRYLVHKQDAEGGEVTVDNRTNISSLDPGNGTGTRQLHVVTSSDASSPDQVTHGGPSNLQGLSNFALSDLDNIEWFVTTIISSNTLNLTANLSDSSYSGFISPTVRIYYTTPDVSFKSGPNFMSSNVDLTKFRGLGDKTSPLQLPPNSEDLFGFTSTIVGEKDNSSQATDSVFGDTANFGKLGKNRGGGTGISSNTGLLDASKAPLSVRKGFQGI